MATLQELEALKSNWRSDPCWDIEGTEGFELHYEELLQYRLGVEEESRREYESFLEQESVKYGIPGNITLTQYIRMLESRLGVLEQAAFEARGR